MTAASAETRLAIVEAKVEKLESLPERVTRVEHGLVALRKEMKAGDDAIRKEMRAGFDQLRQEMKAGDAALRQEMIALNGETRAHMLLLHEEVLSRFALLDEHLGRVPAKDPRAAKTRSKKNG